MNVIEQTKALGGVSCLSGVGLDLGAGAVLACGAQEARGVVVGLVPEEYFIVRVTTGETICPRPGERIQVGLSGSGLAGGVEVEFLNSVRRPDTLLFLSWPFPCGRRDMRREERVDCSIPVAVWTGVECHGARLVNISYGGGKLQFPDEQGKVPEMFSGDHVDLVLEMGKVGCVFMGVSIVNMHRKGGHAYFGFAFSRQKDGTRGLLRDFVDQQKAKR